MKKRKKGVEWPRAKLSAGQKVLYVVAAIISLCMIAVVALLTQLPAYIGFSDGGVIACKARWTQVFIFFLPFFLFFSLIIYLACSYEERKPLFKKSDDKEHRSAADKRVKKRGLIIWCSLLAFNMLLFPLCIFGRRCLTDDYEVKTYNIVNSLSGEYSISDVSSAEVFTKTYSAGKSGTVEYRYGIRLSMRDGMTVEWDRSSFRCFGRTVTDETILQHLLNIRHELSGKTISVDEGCDREKLTAALKLNETEQALLDELLRE